MTQNDFDKTDARLLDLLQREFPLVSRPFEALADKLGITEREVMDRVLRLKSEGLIRQISAIFDSTALGYSSELVAFRVDPDALDTVASEVSAHSGVSHCYSRDAELNLWFTITVGPEADLSAEFRRLSQIPGVISSLRLPQKRLFKIGVYLNVTGESPSDATVTQNEPQPHSKPATLDSRFRPHVRVLQKNLPISGTPFADLATESAMSESELLSAAQQLLADRTMRRYAAVLRHVTAGFEVNAMVCWQAAPQEIENAGQTLAQHPSVSHCYERATSPEWLWPLYTMIHCRTEAELDQVLVELTSASGLSRYRVLRTLREYKKSRVTYFE